MRIRSILRGASCHVYVDLERLVSAARVVLHIELSFSVTINLELTATVGEYASFINSSVALMQVPFLLRELLVGTVLA